MFNFKQISSYFSGFFKPFRSLFSKPQSANFKRLVSGFILADRKNIQEINAVYNNRDQSNLNRFVTQSKWDIKRVNEVRLQIAVKSLGSQETGIIILDDTMTKKTGKKMEKANYHRSGVTKQQEWGHCFVDSLYAEMDSPTVYPVAIDSYLRKVDADKDHPFKTKREIALEQIDFAKSNGVKAKTVMADAAFYAKWLIQALKQRNLNYVLGLRTDIKISIKRKKRISIAKYKEQLNETDFTKFEADNGTYFLHAQEVSIREDRKQTLLISYKEGDKKNVKCYITNHFRWEPFKYMKMLLKRWNIECLHRDTKQHLGLEEYQVRKYRGMRIIVLAILAAYTLLILNAAPKMLQHFRPLQTIGEMCRFSKLIAQKSNYWLKKTFKNLSETRKILNQFVLVKNAKV